MSVHYPSDVFFSISGLQKDRFLLQKTGRIRHSVVLTEEDTGVLRSVHLDVGRESNDSGKLYVRAHYLLHSGIMSNHDDLFLEAQLEERNGLIIVNKANFLGYEVDHTEQEQVFAFANGLNQLIEHVARRHEWTNFIRLFEKAGVKVPTIGRKSLPGLYPNGEIKSHADSALKKRIPSVIDSGMKEPVYPALFFHSIAGCGPEHYSGEKDVTHSFTLRDEESGKLYVWNYSYAQGKTPSHINLSCTLSLHDGVSVTSHPLYKLLAEPQKGRGGQVRLKRLEMYHPNAVTGMDVIDLTKDRSVSDALKVIRMYNRDIRAGIEGMEEDFRRNPEGRRLYYPSDILMLSGLTRSMVPSLSSSKKGRFIFTPLGGQNIREKTSKFDTHIGGNSYRFDYYPPGQERPDAVLIDTGALFHDQFDLTFPNVGKYLYHRFDKSHQPEVNVRALLYTHRHKDHLAQLAYIVKTGYILPRMIMPPLALRQIKREMHELKIDKKIQQEIFDKAIVVEPSSIPANASAENPMCIKQGKQGIEVYWEYLAGERLGQFERYPVAKIGNFKVRIGPMPHSDPGFMYEIITPAGGHLHTGDFKLDPTLQLYQTPYEPWLKAVTSMAVSIDSTGATRQEEETTPTELEIQNSLVRLFSENPQRRFICPVLGSNSSRLTTLIATMGQAGKGYLVVDGKALEDLFDDLEKVHGIKEWAFRVYGVTIAKQGSKEAERIYREVPPENYVITATGTQDEAYSSMNRAMRDWLPDHRFRLQENDLIVPLQGPIPVGKNQFLRKSARYFAEVFHGAKYILPEEIEKEADLVLAGSGHASPADLKKLYSMLPCKISYPVHGGLEQLTAGQKIAQAVGMQSYIADNFESFESLRNGTARLVRRELGESVGIRNRLPTQEQFYLKRNFTSTLMPIKPQDDGDTGKLLQAFEKGLTNALGGNGYNETSQNMAFSLSRTFNISSANGYLTGRYAFGVERYGSDIYSAKRIGGYAAFDTETTGTDPALDHIDQFSLASWSIDKELLFEAELRQAIPDYHTHHPEALLVTNTDPSLQVKGDVPILFSESILKTFQRVKAESKRSYQRSNPEDYADNVKARVKTIIVAHNLKFDDRFIRKTLGENLHERVRPHSTDGMIAIDTRHVARALHAIYPNKFKVRKKTDSDYLDFTLKALCEENGVPYDDEKAHASALYDSHRAMHLFWKMEDIAPEIVAQMVLNADSSTGHLLNDMMGMDTGFGGPYPVFSYLSARADRPDLRLGSFVGTVGGGRYAVVMNMLKSSKGVYDLSPQGLMDKILDRKDDTFELIDLRNNPMIFPAKFFYQKNTSRKYPRETIDRRARHLKDHLNFISPQTGWRNIAERIEEVWKENQSQILTEMVKAYEPDLKYEASGIFKNSNKTMERSISANLVQRAHATFNPPSQAIFKKIKSYRDEALSFFQHGFGNPTRAYKELMKSYGLSTEQAFLLNNIQYDIDRKVMSMEAVFHIQGFRTYNAAQSTQRAVESLEKIGKDPEKFHAHAGPKKKLLGKIRQYVDERKETHKHNEASRNFVHPWRAANTTISALNIA